MYAQRIQIANYGPIDHIDITFPFNGENPKPILLVGENGSGKSVFLSYIVNGLTSAQQVVYPQNSEVQQGSVYKMRSTSYIKSGSEYYWGRVDFEEGLYCEELQLNRLKKDFSEKPAAVETQLWESLADGASNFFFSNFNKNPHQVRDNIFGNNCVLYFPHNRFEEPAWLNEEKLRAKAEYMNLKHIQGYTDRKIINYSPLQANQNWLFEVLYDRCAFEFETLRVSLPIHIPNENPHHTTVPIFTGHRGTATTIYENALSVVRSVFRADGNLRFGIGKRQDRKVSLMQDDTTLVPNIFQLSSGETSLLNLFFSILRDFDLSDTHFTKAEDVRGIVIVDEIDLHLHAIHQYKILPKLIKMFPRVQFIVTTHSPLFVLGMEQTFSPDGFALYRLPQGELISPEEFSEFGSAYRSFAETKQFLEDIKKAVENAQKPILFLDGDTDVKYLQKAAELLNQEAISEQIQIKAGGGYGNLDKIWKNFNPNIAEIIPQKIILLHDCDKPGSENKGNVFRRNIPEQESHPLKEGIENLFERETLERARGFKCAFIDITGERKDIVRAKPKIIPEKWVVNKDEKTNLCNWLCENGTAEDFKHFQVIFDLLKSIIPNGHETAILESPSQSPQPE